MREIKFRAWSKTTNKWHTKVQFGTDCCSSVYCEERKAWLEFDEFCGDMVQWTGLKDKNEIEIYEGDFLADPLMPHLKPMFVRWDNDGAQFFCVDTKRSEIVTSLGYVHGMAKERLSVIGNIHENPELMNL